MPLSEYSDSTAAYIFHLENDSSLRLFHQHFSANDRYFFSKRNQSQHQTNFSEANRDNIKYYTSISNDFFLLTPSRLPDPDTFKYDLHAPRWQLYMDDSFELEQILPKKPLTELLAPTPIYGWSGWSSSPECLVLKNRTVILFFPVESAAWSS